MRENSPPPYSPNAPRKPALKKQLPAQRGKISARIAFTPKAQAKRRRTFPALFGENKLSRAPALSFHDGGNPRRQYRIPQFF
ncbi:MAG: hypothetical protein DBY30_05660 [Verrucomicrobia bacterium]|nr:MAG: hypothetical protein DBY30_05660 [Verrucomicrobiota bacterium]